MFLACAIEAYAQPMPMLAGERFAWFPVVIDGTEVDVLFDHRNDALTRVEMGTPFEKLGSIQPSRLDPDRLLVTSYEWYVDERDVYEGDVEGRRRGLLSRLYACDVERAACEMLHERPGSLGWPVETEYGIFFSSSPVRYRPSHWPPHKVRPHLNDWDLYLLKDDGEVERRSDLKLYDLSGLGIGNGRLVFNTRDSDYSHSSDGGSQTEWVYSTELDPTTRIEADDLAEPLVRAGEWYTLGPSVAPNAPLVAVEAAFDDGTRLWKRKDWMVVVDYTDGSTVHVLDPEPGSQLARPSFLSDTELIFARVDERRVRLVVLELSTGEETTVRTISLPRTGPIPNTRLLTVRGR